jgi:hypothetical protein
MPKSIIKKAAEAHKRRESFLELRNKLRFIEIRLIWEIWKEKDWQYLGFDTFGKYCTAPELSGGLGLSHSWAVQIAETYQKFVKELGMSEKDVSEIGIRKLYEIRDLVNEKNLDDYLASARTLTLADLCKYLKGIDETRCEHEWRIFKRCKKCGVWEREINIKKRNDGERH